MGTAYERLQQIAASDTSSEQDGRFMENLLRRGLGFPSAVVVYGIVYPEGHGTMNFPPSSIQAYAKLIITQYEKGLSSKKNPMNEQERTERFEAMVGGPERGFRLMRIYDGTRESGSAYDRLLNKRLPTKEQNFKGRAKAEGYTDAQITAFLGLQRNPGARFHGEMAEAYDAHGDKRLALEHRTMAATSRLNGIPNPADLYRVFFFDARENMISKDEARNLTFPEADKLVRELRAAKLPAFHQKQTRRLSDLKQASDIELDLPNPYSSGGIAWLADEIILPWMMNYPGDKLSEAEILKYTMKQKGFEGTSLSDVQRALRYLQSSGEVIDSRTKPGHWIALRGGEGYQPNPKGASFLLQQNSWGHITLTNLSTGKNVYFQAQSDVEAVHGMLKKGEIRDLQEGYTVEIKAKEPRASTFSEYFGSSNPSPISLSTKRNGETCRVCGLKTVGTNLCNHCHAHVEGDIKGFGCKYLGNDMWDCGWMDHNQSNPTRYEKGKWPAYNVKYIVGNVEKVLKTGNIDHLSQGAYKFITLHMGFIAHYNLNGFKDSYENVAHLARTLLTSEYSNDRGYNLREAVRRETDGNFNAWYGPAYNKSIADTIRGIVAAVKRAPNIPGYVRKEAPEDPSWNNPRKSTLELPPGWAIYDNGGKTIDRYTLISTGNEMWGFNEQPYHPQGFGQYAGHLDINSRRHLGKRIIYLGRLSPEAQSYVKAVVASERYK
jgi:hypothetical protein